MFDFAQLTIFISVTLSLLIIPGPTVLYIVARSLEQGRFAGFISALGVGLASIVHVIFALLGLSLLLMQSALAFSIVKYLGAAYLIYLGIRTLTRSAQTAAIKKVEPMKLSHVFINGFLVNLFNPKTALFFLAFLPQFVKPSQGPVWLQISILGTIFVGLAIINDGILSFIAGSAREFLSASLWLARAQKYLAGCIYIALGITTALSGSGRAK